MNAKTKLLSFLVIPIVAACGGGGGSSSGSGGGSDFSGAVWEVSAPITQNGCGERIADVRQKFRFDNDTINTGIISLAKTDTGSGFSFGFTETNGNCTRTYTGEFSNTTSSSADVSLVSASNCGGSTCENRWAGTAVPAAE